MDILLSFVLQLAGSYVLYCTSSRAVFVKRWFASFLYRRRWLARVLGALLLLASLWLYMTSMGASVGLLFATTSLMAISGCIILLLPLFKNR